MGAARVELSRPHGYEHVALVYAGAEEFLAGTVPFVSQAVAAGESVLVALPRTRVDLLQDALSQDIAAHATFLAMEDIGRNPATIIPAWQQFLDDRPADGRPVWGIGEPIWEARTEAELSECHLHEALLNEAFTDVQAFTLLCPYDTTTLAQTTVEEARRTHPILRQNGERFASDSYAAPEVLDVRFRSPLSPPIEEPRYLPIVGSAQDRRLRAEVSAHGVACGLSPARIQDLVLASSEIMTNAVRHGGGHGTLVLWRDGDRAVCEVRDSGSLEDKMVGRLHPGHEGGGGRGLWITNQLCDLVQIRATPDGTVVRIHVGPERHTP